MLAHAAIRRLVTTALAAWVVLCCCERRIYAEVLLGVDAQGCAAQGCCVAEVAPPPCCAHCAAESDGPEEAAPCEDEPPTDGSCCSDGCCDKSAAPASTFTVALDAIGAPLPTTLELVPTSETAASAPAHGDRDRCRPPPWRVLIDSARLRI